MRILTAASMAVALVASTAAFAATTPAPAPAVQQQVPEPGQPQLAQQPKPAAVRKAALHRRDVIGDRETAALNSLEASGYFTIKDISPDGRNIAADAKKPGASFTHLTVLPDGTIQTAANPAT